MDVALLKHIAIPVRWPLASWNYFTICRTLTV